MSEDESDNCGVSGKGEGGDALGQGQAAAGAGAAGKTAGSWETLVLFAVNFTRLSVQMNMGNVMGNVV